MNALRLPTVQRTANGRYAVEIAKGITLAWWWEMQSGALHCFIRVTGQGTDEAILERDVVSFPTKVLQ
jgi:hypothetical protein